MSQACLGKRCSFCFAEVTGLKRNTIACYETARRECDFDTLLMFADVLKCSTDDLLKEYVETEN